MPKYTVLWEDEIDAPDEETAAVLACRLFLTHRPQEFAVKPDRGKTIWIRVDSGEGKRM